MFETTNQTHTELTIKLHNQLHSWHFLSSASASWTAGMPESSWAGWGCWPKIKQQHNNTPHITLNRGLGNCIELCAWVLFLYIWSKSYPVENPGKEGLFISQLEYWVLVSVYQTFHSMCPFFVRSRACSSRQILRSNGVRSNWIPGISEEKSQGLSRSVRVCKHIPRGSRICCFFFKML